MSMTPRGHILTPQGRAINLRNPSIEHADLVWMRNRLRKIPRYNGQLRVPWSVWDHTTVVSRVTGFLVAKEHPALAALHAARLAGLIHDYHEALIGDIIRPVEDVLDRHQLLNLKAVLDNRIMEAIVPQAAMQRLVAGSWSFVDLADRITAAAEWTSVVDCVTPVEDVFGREMIVTESYLYALDLIQRRLQRRRQRLSYAEIDEVNP